MVKNLRNPNKYTIVSAACRVEIIVLNLHLILYKISSFCLCLNLACSISVSVFLELLIQETNKLMQTLRRRKPNCKPVTAVKTNLGVQ